MKNPIYFISDVHFYLKENQTEKDKLNKVSGLIDEVIENHGTLFIVGDFFDFWFEYKDVVPRQYFQILYKLRALKMANCELYYVAGNHDFWLYDFIKNEIGAKVYYDPLEINVEGKKFYIAHGDGIDKNNRGYNFLKSILRNKFFIKLFALITPSLAFKIARVISSTSRKYDNKTIEIEKQNRLNLIDFAKKKFNNGFDYVILGHYHLPEEFHQDEHVYLNCGDWLKHYSYGIFKNNNLKLEYWEKE